MHLQSRILSQRVDAPSHSSFCEYSVLATEFNPALKWLGHRVAADAEGREILNKVDYAEDDCKGMSIDEEIDDDEIEEW